MSSQSIARQSVARKSISPQTTALSNPENRTDNEYFNLFESDLQETQKSIYESVKKHASVRNQINNLVLKIITKIFIGSPLLQNNTLENLNVLTVQRHLHHASSENTLSEKINKLIGQIENLTLPTDLSECIDTLCINELKMKIETKSPKNKINSDRKNPYLTTRNSVSKTSLSNQNHPSDIPVNESLDKQDSPNPDVDGSQSNAKAEYLLLDKTKDYIRFFDFLSEVVFLLNNIEAGFSILEKDTNNYNFETINSAYSAIFPNTHQIDFIICVFSKIAVISMDNLFKMLLENQYILAQL